MSFGPLSQEPFGMPRETKPDPPGYYAGWPLSGVGKRVISATLDYGVLWIACIIVVGLGSKAAHAAGENAGAGTALWLLVGAYAFEFWNLNVRQGRGGQSLGKQLMGTRLVKMATMGAPGIGTCFFRGFVLIFDLGFFAIGVPAIAFGVRRQSFGDRFAGTVVIDEAQAGARIAWSVPGERAHALEPPEPQGAIYGWRAPSSWRQAAERLREMFQSRPSAQPAGTGEVADAEVIDESGRPTRAPVFEPALPDLDDPEDEIPQPPPPQPVPEPVAEPARMPLPPVGGYRGGKLWEPGPSDAAGWARHRQLSDRLERMAQQQGGSPPRKFVSEDVVVALESKNPDEAFLVAGGQAREFLRSFVNPDPPARQGAIADMTADFARLARLLGSDAGDLPEDEIRHRLGLRGAWEKAGRDVLAPVMPGIPSPGYFGEASGYITTAAEAGELEKAELRARQTLEAKFTAGEPVSLERAMAQYRQLLADGGVKDDLDNAALERRLGLVHTG